MRWSALALLLCACSRAPVGPPLSYVAPQWADGEETTYDVYGADGKRLSGATYRWTKGEAGWTLTREGIEKKSSVELTLEASGSPAHVRIERESGDAAEAWFLPNQIRMTRTVKGTPSEKVVERPADAVEAREFYQPLRLLPLTAGYAHQVTMVDVVGLDTVAMDVSVVGEESITVPAGTFQAWHVVVDTRVSGKRDLWYAKDAPGLWLKYRWPGRSTVQLRSYRLAPGAPLVAPTEPAVQLAGTDGPLPPINLAVALAQTLVQLPLSILFPLLLGVWLMIRLKVHVRVWLAGLVCFPLSQVVHLPLNSLLGIGGMQASGPLTGIPFPLYALLGGLTAGLCEEVARYAVMRLALRRDRGSRPALVFGAGHGGIEAVILSGLGALVGIQLIAVQVLHVPLAPEQRDAARMAIETFAEVRWWEPIYAGIERLGAMSLHILLSVWVMRAVTQKNVRWLAGAIALHAVVDAPVFYKHELGPHVLLAMIVGVGALAVWGARSSLQWTERPSDG